LETSTSRTLDFDIETRRVGFHTGFKGKPDGCEPIAIACSWIGEEEVRSIILGSVDHDSVVAMLEWFLEFYNEATMVTGHYITKFDLPILNTAMLEWDLPPLGAKLAQDTKTGLIDFEGYSKSQENLGKLAQIDAGKYHMSDADWRRFTRLTLGGQKRGRKRVEADVVQHKQMRLELMRRGMLNDPVLWKP
jgi:predicted PolB exonuclease-like 3'-5' exonuclease